MQVANDVGALHSLSKRRLHASECQYVFIKAMILRVYIPVCMCDSTIVVGATLDGAGIGRLVLSAANFLFIRTSILLPPARVCVYICLCHMCLYVACVAYTSPFASQFYLNSVAIPMSKVDRAHLATLCGRFISATFELHAGTPLLPVLQAQRTYLRLLAHSLIYR